MFYVNKLKGSRNMVKNKEKKSPCWALMAFFLLLAYSLVANFLKTWDDILMTLCVCMNMQPQSAFQDTWLLLRRWLWSRGWELSSETAKKLWIVEQLHAAVHGHPSLPDYWISKCRRYLQSGAFAVILKYNQKQKVQRRTDNRGLNLIC